jgi:hypothetical protein
LSKYRKQQDNIRPLYTMDYSNQLFLIQADRI